MILVTKAQEHRRRTAIVDIHGHYSYQNLEDTSAYIAKKLLKLNADYQNIPITFLIPPSFEYVAVQWGIWRAGAIAVPIALTHPPAEVNYVLEDSQARIIFAHSTYLEKVQKIAQKRSIQIIEISSELLAQAQQDFNTKTDTKYQKTSLKLPEISDDRSAMMIYTSGTTNRPKGVVTTHGNIKAQIKTLVEAWGWESSDYILNILPLHHVHGVINVVSCALYAGATCEMHERFNVERTWEVLASGRLTLFMAVPTIYQKLIQFWEKSPAYEKTYLSNQICKLRLMVSGSAALPVTVLQKWKSISTHTLLERYGMTEIGMGLSNSLNGERLVGKVGKPLPNVEIRLVDEKGKTIEEIAQSGEIQIKSPSVFKEYWKKPEATQEAFTEEGWFITGDIAQRDEDGNYQILGRKSQDIIKTGGFKVSALEIESILLTLQEIEECAVVGIPHDEFGEKVGILFMSNISDINLENLKEKSKKYLAPYKVPSFWKKVEKLPRNAMGKVLKPTVRKQFSAKDKV